MSDFLQQFGAELAAEVTAEVLKNLRREITQVSKDAVKLCFTEKEAAKLLGYSSEQTLYRKRKNGEISYSTAPNGTIVYTPAQLEDYLDKTEVVRVGGQKAAKKTVLSFPKQRTG